MDIDIIGTDDAGNITESTISVDLTDLNDAPEIDLAATLSGNAIEISESSTSSSEGDLISLNGDIAFHDDDVGDTHTYLNSPLIDGGTGYLGVFSFGEVNPTDANGDGLARWTFDVSDADIDFLREGEVITQTYNISIEDANGLIVSQTVTITITGTNDAPVIQSVDNLSLIHISEPTRPY